ncbi:MULTISPECIES: helix-turn-helix domain-containing protein [Halomonas]|uniref:helix-turn-helix domain-containing protein n=1 Tax=Halomonas TaxID=2745 RepID=UPI001C98D86B|nr:MULTISPECIES: helix-turn-helix transcriptional regulator [Halomonas]MBY6207466.1 helix-turn-helix domain-containing protein [Halomonas sp. DP3Y7-2]MBY6228275.1 helix-turn-helix domain-containing protein [Halomonas sp. DP3Y7-1]MCA0916340.1 helix-turn-helix domain-containing protein [Halomonas denitrificans]
MFPFRFRQGTQQNAADAAEPHASPSLGPLAADATEDAQRRLDAMERDEPKRRLIRDAKALAKTRKITQAQMAEEMGVPHRTLEEWLQFRRMPKAPGTTLLQRWVAAHSRAE